MDTMQADALRRAREMHSPPPRGEHRSPETAEQTRRSEHPSPELNPQAPSVCTSEEQAISNRPCKEIQENPLFADKEKFLILALILILSSEEQSDPVLTLALLYLII